LPILCAALVGFPLLTSNSSQAALIAEYSFDAPGTIVPDNIPADPNFDMTVQPNGSGFDHANLFGTSRAGTLLGGAGRATEPVEPTSEDNNYAFWVPKNIIADEPAWTVLMWVNRHDLENRDMFFYVGTGDGFGGTGGETYVFGETDGQLGLHNYLGTSNFDANVTGGTLVPGRWHHVGLVRAGASLSLYLDGSHLGTADNVNLTSFENAANSVLVFGAAKWMRLASQRTRVLDGLIDQIEIYDHALSQPEIEERYRAFVPEPNTMMLFTLGGLGLCSWPVPLWRRLRNVR
jgi:hypothetical protein